MIRLSGRGELQGLPERVSVPVRALKGRELMCYMKARFMKCIH